MTLAGNLTTNGTTVLTADNDGLGSGDLSLAALKTIDTGGSAATLTASDIILEGSLTTGAAALNLLVSDGGTIGLGDAVKDYTLDKLELSRIISGDTQIGDASSGSITVNNVSESDSDGISGMLTLDASKDKSSIVFETVASIFNALTAKSDDGIAISVDLTTDTGDMILEGDADGNIDTAGDDIVLSGARTLTSAGNMTLDATKGNITADSTLNLTAIDNLSINDSLTTAGVTTLTADSDGLGSGDLSLASGKTINTGGSAATLTASDIILEGSLTTGAAALNLLVSDGATTDATIGLGDADKDFDLTGAELGRITAGDVQIGDSTSGSITVDNVTAANSNGMSGLVTLDATKTGADIIFENAASTFNSILATADDTMQIFVDLTTDVGDMTLDGTMTFDGDRTLISEENMLLNPTGDSITGTGAVTLNANADIDINGDMTTAGVITISVDHDDLGIDDTLTVAAGKTIDSQDSDVSITTKALVLDGSLNLGAGNLSIFSSGDDAWISLGTEDLTLAVSNDELSRITVSGETQIGGSNIRSIQSKGVTEAATDGITGMLTLNATANEGEVLFWAGSSTFNSVTVNADDRILVAADLITDRGDMILEGDSDNSSDSDNGIFINDNRTISSAGSMTLDATTGGISGTGAFTLTAEDDLFINESVVSAGITTIHADSNDDASGNFKLLAGKTVNTTNEALNVLGADIILDGSLNSGTGDTSISMTAGNLTTFGGGATASAGHYDEAELARTTAGNLTVGGDLSGTINVEGISLSKLATINDAVNLKALRDDASVNFVTAPNTFKTLTVEADDGIYIDFLRP
ncbi:hypothetical protein AB751O23_AZ_00040 [Chlamydiales bacterium SCGC AB-751-O23]|nr:hypothetical protein AB751O23_AZ_00040 [Chlamydiales bacterium SCGC AB-751-O23]